MSRYRLLVLSVLLLLCGITACYSATPTVTAPISSRPTSTLTLERTETTAPTKPPAPTQFATPTLEPETNPERITPGSAVDVVPLAKLGKGTILAHPSDAPEGMAIYSPDGKWLAIPTTAGIYLYDAITFEESHSIPVGNTFIFSPDGSLMAAGGKGSISLWETGTGRQAGELTGNPDDYYWGAAFSPDGSMLAVLSWQREIAVWSLKRQETLFSFPGDRLRFSPDGELAVAVVYGENRVHLYRTQDGSEVNKWNTRSAGFAPGGQLWLADEESLRLVYVDRDQVTAPFGGVQPAFSADGTTMALYAHNQISLYDPQKGRRKVMLEGDYFQIDGVVFSPDGQTVAGDVYTLHCQSCTEMDGLDRSLVLWRTSDGAIIASIDHPTGWIAYAVDGSSLAALEMESIQVINTSDGSVVKKIDGFTNAIEGMALSPDGRMLAAAHAAGDYTLRFWDLETGQVERELPSREGGITLTNVSVSYSPDGKILAVGGDLWDLTTDSQMTSIEQSIGEKTSCWPDHAAFAPAENLLATGCFYGQLDLWQIPSGRLQKSLHSYESWVNEMAFSPDGKQLAAIYNVPDFLVQVWQLPEGRASYTLSGGHFTRVAYSSDGLILATVLANPDFDQYGWPAGYVQLWDAADGNMRARLAIEDAVSIAFSPDGLTLATGSLDGTLRLWAIERGELLLESKAHYSQIQRLVFTSDGASLVSGSQDGTILRWGISPAP